MLTITPPPPPPPLQGRRLVLRHLRSTTSHCPWRRELQLHDDRRVVGVVVLVAGRGWVGGGVWRVCGWDEEVYDRRANGGGDMYGGVLLLHGSIVQRSAQRREHGNDSPTRRLADSPTHR